MPGSVFILTLNSDGTVDSEVEITDSSAGFPFSLANGDAFGAAVAVLADMNDDGVQELAVGASNHDTVYLLSLFSNGTVNQGVEITSIPDVTVSSNSEFGFALTAIDLDNDGMDELVAGAPADSTDDTDAGLVFIMFFFSFAQPTRGANISRADVMTSNPSFVFKFGSSLASVGDLNADGIPDLLIGAPEAFVDLPDFFPNTGSLAVVFMNSDGSVLSSQEVRTCSCPCPCVALPLVTTVFVCLFASFSDRHFGRTFLHHRGCRIV